MFAVEIVFSPTDNNNNNKVDVYCACPYINMFALGTLQNELRQKTLKKTHISHQATK